MVTRVRATKRSRLTIPLSELPDFDPIDVKEAFMVDNFNEYGCAKCPLKSKRLTDQCFDCEHYHGTTELATIVKNKKTKVRSLSFPIGARSEIERRMGIKLRVKDKVNIKGRMLKRPIKMIRELYDGTPAADGTTRINQQQVVADFLALEDKCGVIWASARSGKTVLAVAISCALGGRTLIVIDRIELLNQFRETYLGSPDGGTRVRMTDAKEKRVIIINKMADFDKPHDVALISYQKMIRDTGPALVAKHIKGKYLFLVNDETHQASADAYSRFMLRLDMPYRLGLSATPKRKDGRYRLTDTIIGPVVIRTKNVGLKPLIKVRNTGLFGDLRINAWHAISNLIAVTEERNQMVVNETFRMLDDGHKAIIIPVDRVEHVNILVEMINDKHLARWRKAGRAGPESIAISLMGSTKNRPGVLAAFDSEDSDNSVLVCMRSIIKQGVDVSRPSGVICPIPMSGKQGVGAPLFGQLSYRASTATPGKRQPEVILMADELPFVRNQIEGLFRTEINPNSDLLVGVDKCVYKLDLSCAPYANLPPARWK